MSLTRAPHRKSTDVASTDKTSSDKSKNVAGHTGTKNGLLAKPETQGRKGTLKKAKSVDHSNALSKLDTKKSTSIDTHTKATHTAGSVHTNETTKSHGKTAVLSRSDTHGKTGSHGTTKKAEVPKPRANKLGKTEPDKNNPDKNDHKGIDDAITTAVSQHSENVSIEISDEEEDEN